MSSRLDISMASGPAVFDRAYPEADRYLDLSVTGRATRQQIGFLTDLLALLESQPPVLYFEHGAGI